MTTLRTAAQQALEALETPIQPLKAFMQRQAAITVLRAALAEPTTEDSSAVEPVAWGCFKDGELQVELVGTKADVDFWVASDEPHMQGMVAGPLYTTLSAALAEPVQEPPCATRECMPSECPNCVSLQDQNTELDRKLADLEQTSLELCNVCGWRTLIPGDCCLNCERKHPLGQASTDVGVPVYVVKKAEPVQEPVAYSVGRTLHWHEGRGVNDAQLYAAPPQRPAEPVQEPAQPNTLHGWVFKRNADGSVGIFAPPPNPGESRRTSDCVGPQDRDLHELLGKLADHMTALAEPVQEPVAWMTVRLNVPIQTTARKDVADEWLKWGEVQPLFTAPPQRKPPATIDEMFDRMDKAPKGVFFGHDPMTIWMEAWRAAEQHHGIK